MIIFKKAADLKIYISKCKSENGKVGFVPTMGALHNGHLSLIEQCNSEADISVCSIFINPTQFNNSDDLKKYPVTIEQDIYLLEQNNCDALFLPDVTEMYPDGVINNDPIDLGYLENILEGKYRPGHFQGVCQVVKRLLEIVEPHIMFLGQKDYQQCMVLKKLLEQIKSETRLRISATVRMDSGLAMSSRNLRLSKNERELAKEIFTVLLFIKENISTTAFETLKKEAFDKLTAHGFKVDYIEIADAETLLPIKKITDTKSIVVPVAAYLNDVRLIDNILINSDRD